MKGKKRQSLLLTRKKPKNAYSTKVRTPFIKSRIASDILKGKPIP